MKRVLLDNNVNHRFIGLIHGHEVIHARKMGWSDQQNGMLISKAEEEQFQILITADKQMQYQQNLKDRKISIIVLANNLLNWDSIAPLAAQVQKILDGEVKEGSFITIRPTV